MTPDQQRRRDELMNSLRVTLGWRIAEAVERHSSAIVDRAYVEEMEVRALVSRLVQAQDEQAKEMDALRATARAVKVGMSVGRPVQQAQDWQPIATADTTSDEWVLVALIRDGKVQRASEAQFFHIGWYDRAGHSCHWRTHWMRMPPLPAPPSAPPEEPT